MLNLESPPCGPQAALRGMVPLKLTVVLESWISPNGIRLVCSLGHFKLSRSQKKGGPPNKGSTRGWIRERSATLHLSGVG